VFPDIMIFPINSVSVKVGVGDGDMGALVQLDSDKARLSWGEEQADRDIVQFVGENDQGRME
jgi:hypothetical protein